MCTMKIFKKNIEFPAQVHQKSILDIPTSKMM